MSEHIEREAKRWMEKLPSATDEEFQAFQKWMMADPEHMRVFGQELKKLLQEARRSVELRKARRAPRKA